MKKYFSVLLQFLNQLRVRCSSRFNRLQRVTTVAALTTALILFAHQAYAFDIGDELDNCFSGGCDPTRPEVIQSVTKRVEEVRETIKSVNWEELVEYYNNPSSAYRALWREIANVADTALNGIISRNFGHVTNKSELRRALESQGIVIYGLEISHDEYYTATTYAAASVVSENPAPLIYYFKDLAYRSYSEMLLNLNRAIEEAPERLQGQYATELRQLEEALSIEYIATALASYVSTGEVPDISFDIDLSTADIRFGVLTYSRGERTPTGTIVTPNTHQPYIIVTPPGLGIRIAQTIKDYTVPQEDITSFGATPQNVISNDLCWYRHEGWQDGSNNWANDNCIKVGSGWNFKTGFASSNGVIYGITSSNELCWYGHEGWQDGSNTWASDNCTSVGNGWNFKTVFASSDGIIYGITSSNELCWYRHDGWQDGSNRWASGNCTKVGNGWNFKTVFASSNGVIYGITSSNELCWYRHDGWQDGSNRWASGNCTKVGNGWNFKTVFASRNSVIYGVKSNGDLYWYRHDGWQDGSNRWANGGTGIKVGSGWNFQSIFATSDGTVYGIVR